ncbi:MAG TPA: A/G-specific adenine glycosylase [Terriglobales bacterium]|nr:A/G-specific adenine glycosylase [Terriglobales bacterium]
MLLSPPLHHPEQIASFRRRLSRWYQRSKRELPWRGERDPYRIWVSEIMLQQTRVAVAVARYPRFLRRFPDIKRLARSPLSQVLAEWSGLGYYRRARNLHAAARELTRRQQRFPRTAAEMQELPGIGRYTAAAIASIAFAEPVAVVDGNVERVLRRLLAPASPDCWNAAQQLLDPQRPGDFNQAMMELGATVCLPSKPECGVCPLSSFCPLSEVGNRKKAQPRKTRKRKTVAHAIVRKAGRILLVRRPQNTSLMPGMWELPLLRSAPQRVHLRLRHSITDTDYEVLVSIRSITGLKNRGGRWFHPRQLDQVPITGLTRKILKRAAVFGIELGGDK